MPNHQKTQLCYIQWQDDFRTQKPYQMLMDVPEGFPKSNFSVSPEPEQIIHDLRGQETDFSLDDHGFCVENDMQEDLDWNRETVESEYFSQVEAILKRAIGPDIRVHIFDWRVRGVHVDVKKANL
jgi:hypothetical protein